MKRISLALNVLLLALVGAMVYYFIISGSVEESADGRTAVLLSTSERQLVLGEMRAFLENTRDMVAALGEGDMAAFAAAADRNGIANQSPPPASLVAKLPVEFLTLGMDTHKAFDGLSARAKAGMDPEQAAAGLGDIMNNCTACHASYLLKAVAE